MVDLLVEDVPTGGFGCLMFDRERRSSPLKATRTTSAVSLSVPTGVPHCRDPQMHLCDVGISEIAIRPAVFAEYIATPFGLSAAIGGVGVLYQLEETAAVSSRSSQMKPMESAEVSG